MKRTLKYRIYPDRKQKERIARCLGNARFVYNHFLREQQEALAGRGRPLSREDMTRKITPLKKKHPFLRDGESSSLCRAAGQLDRALRTGMRRAFAGGSEPPAPRHPDRFNQSYTVSGTGVRITEPDRKHIRIPRLGAVRASLHRLPEEGERILSAKITRDGAGRYYAALQTELPDRPAAVPESPKVIGLVFSSERLYVDSDGKSPDWPPYTDRIEERVSRDRRRMERKKKGTSARARARTRYLKSLEKRERVRKDRLHKITAELASRCDVAAVESPYLSCPPGEGWLYGPEAAADWNKFCGMLQYKLERKGGRLITTGSAEPARGGDLWTGLARGVRDKAEKLQNPPE